MAGGQDQVQGVDYAYTFHGWLKGVNSTTLDRTRDIGKDAHTADNQFFGVDAIGFSLGYFTNDYVALKDAAETPDVMTNNYFAGTSAVSSLNLNPDAHALNQPMGSLYNGNITHMVTAMRKDDESKLDILANNYQYDQLQRIREMKVYNAANLQANNAFTGAVPYLSGSGNSAYQEQYTFDKNGNLKSLKRYGNILQSGAVKMMDDFTYKYYSDPNNSTSTELTDPSKTNRLSTVADVAGLSGNYSGDIDGYGIKNYQYDNAGRLTFDATENITSIEWTVTNKVKKMTFTGRPTVRFVYDAMDRRIIKIVHTTSTTRTFTYYSYDATGNVLATYDRVMQFTSGSNWTDKVYLNEHYLYGAERIGVENDYKELNSRNITATGDVELGTTNGLVTTLVYDITFRKYGDKNYELANHLGNVLAVVTDRKKTITDNGTLVYSPDIINYADYSPYGVRLDGRFHVGTEAYRYGYQGSEMDNEIKNDGNSYTTMNRILDPRIGRWLTIDPVTDPSSSPYNSMDNNPVRFNDVLGLYTEKQARRMDRRAERHGFSGRAFYDSDKKEWGVVFTKNNEEGTWMKTQYRGKFNGFKHGGNLAKAGFTRWQVGIGDLEAVDEETYYGTSGDFNQVGGRGTYGGVNISESNGAIYEQMDATTVIKRPSGGYFYPEYMSIAPQSMGTQGTLGSDGRYWIGCLSCHSPLGARAYASHHSYEGLAGKVFGESVSILGTGAIGEIGAPRAAISVTERSIVRALKGSSMKTLQGEVSLPMVQRYVGYLESGRVAPAIKVSNNVIIEGNHRYVAGRIFGTEPAQVPGTLAPSQAYRIKPIQQTKVNPKDLGGY